MQIHPEKHVLDAYTLKALSRSELTAIILHIDECAECSKYVKEHSFIPNKADVLPFSRSPDVAFHLTYEEHLAPYANNIAEASLRKIVEDHIGQCQECKFLLEDLQAFAADENTILYENLHGPTGRSIWKALLRFKSPVPGFGAAVLALSAVLYFWISGTKTVNELSEIASADRDVNIEAVPRPTVEANLPLDSTERPAVRQNNEIQNTHAVTDKSSDIAERASTSGLPDVIREKIADALRSEKIIASPALALLTRDITLRSDGETTSRSGVPDGVVIRETSPRLSWNRTDGDNYTVKIFDEDFEIIAESQDVEINSWRPETPLQRGKVYWWEALSDDNAIASGKFKVLGEAELRILRSVGKTDPIVRGLALYHFGLVDEARIEFERSAKTDKTGRANKFLKQMNAK